MKPDDEHPADRALPGQSHVPARVPAHPGEGLLIATSRERAAYTAGRRVRVLYALLLVAIGAAGGAWLAGTYIQSPAEMAARVAPPQASPILVPVEERVLSSNVITRGTARFGLPQPVALAPSALKSGPGVITTLPLRNAQLQEGDVVLTASGRPVFILQGKVPAYRDLTPEVTGEDVRQLKQALIRLGFSPGDPDTQFDRQTSGAIEQWYRSKGWDPFGPTRDQLANTRLLERDLADALKAKAAAAASAETARTAIDAARATTVHAVRAAAIDNAARSPQQDPTMASMLVENERTKARLANTTADAEVATQIAAEQVIVLDPRQTETARQTAKARVEQARAAQEKARLDGEIAIQAAEREAGLATRRLEVGRAAERSARLEGERAIRTGVEAANLAALDLKITTARADHAAADLASLKKKLGVQVPIDEVVFVPALPVRVEEVTATIGHPLSGTVLTVTDNQLAVDAALPLNSAPLVKVGMPVSIDEQALGIKATGTVETVATTPGTRGVDGFHIYLGVRVDNTPVPLAGFSVRLTIPIESTNGAVLAVPVSALSLATDGSSRVQVKTDRGLEYFPVKPGLSAGGFVQVTAVSAKLAPGQQVVVGYNNPMRTETP